MSWKKELRQPIYLFPSFSRLLLQQKNNIEGTSSTVLWSYFGIQGHASFNWSSPTWWEAILPDQPRSVCCWCPILKMSSCWTFFRGGKILLTSYLFSIQIPVFKKAIRIHISKITNPANLLQWSKRTKICSKPSIPCSPSPLQIDTQTSHNRVSAVVQTESFSFNWDQKNT